MEVVGYRAINFRGSDGNMVDGVTIYCTYPLDKGEGIGTERFFFSRQKLDKSDYRPSVGDDIDVTFNRYGKPDMIICK